MSFLIINSGNIVTLINAWNNHYWLTLDTATNRLNFLQFCVGEEDGEDEDGASFRSGSRTTESASSGIGMSEKDSDLNISKMSAVSDIVKTTVKLQKENGSFFKGSSSSQSNLSNDKNEEAENRRFSDWLNIKRSW